MRLLRILLIPAVACLLVMGSATAGGAAGLASHGQTLARVSTNQSSNWGGYMQGTIEKGGKIFTQIAGDWVVPTASQHTRGADEYSSVWIGIGGGCLDANCLTQDQTLIQTGTEQDVAADGTPSYSAWWEIIPGPSLEITNMPVNPGDAFHADIREVGTTGSNVWTITLTSVTRNVTFTQTVPYASGHGSAEWITETPLILGTNAGFASMPNLGTVSFTNAQTNSASAALIASEKIELVSGSTKVVEPSNPLSATSFHDCVWSATCS
ncbi:MAG: hypothetical protein QOG03_236 [Actinomycetota bacterium]|jgi:hypothetical protein|nr:hypothetical protein [Actinomycetota bacterium]